MLLLFPPPGSAMARWHGEKSYRFARRARDKRPRVFRDFVRKMWLARTVLNKAQRKEEEIPF